MAAQLPAIEVDTAELGRRLRLVQPGSTLAEVNRCLGGEPFQNEIHAQRRVYFWRFKIRDAAIPRHQYEIYRGEFEQDRLITGILLPTA